MGNVIDSRYESVIVIFYCPALVCISQHREMDWLTQVQRESLVNKTKGIALDKTHFTAISQS